MKKIKGLIFDFDGLIIDTETPTLQSWQEIYRSHNCELPLNDYFLTIGTTDHLFDPLKHLISLSSEQINIEKNINLHRARMLELIKENELLPGVFEYFLRAKELNLKLGIASSGIGWWINQLLKEKKIHHFFDCVITSDMVPAPKPAPDLYLSALECLDLLSTETIAFEDSPNGIAAASQAGIFCVVVPNHLTKQMDTSLADLRFESLAGMKLDELLLLVENRLK